MAIAKERYFHQRGMNPLRSFGFVGNCVYQYAALAQAPDKSVHGRTFYMADYETVRVREWANLIQREMGVSRVREIPFSALMVAAKFGDICSYLGWKHPPLTSFRLKNLTSDNYCEMDAVRDAIGELPFTIEEGVHLTVSWLHAQQLLPVKAG